MYEAGLDALKIMKLIHYRQPNNSVNANRQLRCASFERRGRRKKGTFMRGVLDIIKGCRVTRIVDER